MWTTAALIDALCILQVSREDLKDLLGTYEHLELLKPPVVNGWFIPSYHSLLSGAVVLLRPNDQAAKAQRISRLERSGPIWRLHLEGGSVVAPDDVSDVAPDQLNEEELSRLAEELRSDLRRGRRSPITLAEGLQFTERKLQMNKCEEPVRRLCAMMEQARRLEGILSFVYRPEGAAAGAGAGANTEGIGFLEQPLSLTQMWDEAVQLASKITLALRKQLTAEEQQRVEKALRGFCMEENGEVEAGGA